MLTMAHWVFFSFVLIIVAVLIWRKPPILPGAVGLFAVGLADQLNFPGAIEVAFRALILATQNLLSIILLIGIVVGMTKLLRDTGADIYLTKPLRKLKGPVVNFWVLGLVTWGLTLFLWPTPSVTLLGAVIIPNLLKVGVSPMAIAMSLTVFGEGLGLSGDFIIQGAPSLMSKTTGIPLTDILSTSWPIVLASGFLAALVSFWRQKNLHRDESIEKGTGVNSEDLTEAITIVNNKLPRYFSIIVIIGYALTVAILIFGRIKGDSASAMTGGVSLIILLTGSVLKDREKAFLSFIEYLRHGFRFSMGVFTPIVIMSGFFFLGTVSGTEAIFHRQGIGYFGDFANVLAGKVLLNKWFVGLIIMLTAILGSMDGSGFSGLPLTGGIAVALSHAANLPVLPLAILGQVVAIWTGAALIPWGFSAVTAAVTGVDSAALSRKNFPAYTAAIITAFIWAMFKI